MTIRKFLAAGAALILLATAEVPANAQGVSAERLDQIYAMDARKMAATGAWIVAANDDLMAVINGMQNKVFRDLVLDMVTNPRSEVFNATAPKDAYRIAPPTGGPGHHHYPGGLAVHAIENIRIAFGWIDTMEKVQQMQNVDRDLVIASLVLHDWAKVWYEWDEEAGKISKPDWYPESWGGADGKAKWKWMGEHGAVVYAELIARGAPEELIIATAAAHFDPQWDLDKDGEGLNPALAEAAKIAGKPPIVVSPDKRMLEWWLATYSDGSWSMSHYAVGKFAFTVIDAVAVDLGLEAGSPKARKLAMFVLSRVSDFRVYENYQQNGFSMDKVKAFVVSILKDSSAFEVPES
jgi:hypothetical protein